MRREVVNLDTLAKAQVKVPQVIDGNTDQYADTETTLYFVMDYIRGKPLTDEVAGRRRVPLDHAVKLIKDLCSTVAAAHRNDVLHRDLKPDNIMVRDFEAADLVIVDYGLSYLEEESSQDLTRLGEQFRNRFLALPETNTPGGDRRDQRSDVTAVAGVLYYCLTGFEPGHLRDSNGRPPHRRQGSSVREALANDGRCEQVEGLLDRAFAVEVENRFQSCDEFVGRLDAALKPPAPDEDPAIVSAELVKLLRVQDRKTLLAEYGQIAQKVMQKIQQQGSLLASQMARPFTVTMGLGVPQGQALPDGIDLLGREGLTFNVGLPHHDRSWSVGFAGGAKGQECAILRCTSSQTGSAAGVFNMNTKAAVNRWEPVIWFLPENVPDDDKIRSVLRESVNIALRALAREVMPT